jgi:hypothetical protein
MLRFQFGLLKQHCLQMSMAMWKAGRSDCWRPFSPVAVRVFTTSTRKLSVPVELLGGIIETGMHPQRSPEKTRS